MVCWESVGESKSSRDIESDFGIAGMFFNDVVLYSTVLPSCVHFMFHKTAASNNIKIPKGLDTYNPWIYKIQILHYVSVINAADAL